MTTSLKGLLLVLVLMLVMTCVIPYYYEVLTAEATALGGNVGVRGGVQDTTNAWKAFVMAIIASVSAIAAKRNDGVNVVG